MASRHESLHRESMEFFRRGRSSSESKANGSPPHGPAAGNFPSSSPVGETAARRRPLSAPNKSSSASPVCARTSNSAWIDSRTESMLPEIDRTAQQPAAQYTSEQGGVFRYRGKNCSGSRDKISYAPPSTYARSESPEKNPAEATKRFPERMDESSVLHDVFEISDEASYELQHAVQSGILQVSTCDDSLFSMIHFRA